MVRLPQGRFCPQSGRSACLAALRSSEWLFRAHFDGCCTDHECLVNAQLLKFLTKRAWAGSYISTELTGEVRLIGKPGQEADLSEALAFGST